jgi:phage FluMu protein Com
MIDNKIVESTYRCSFCDTLSQRTSSQRYLKMFCEECKAVQKHIYHRVYKPREERRKKLYRVVQCVYFEVEMDSVEAISKVEALELVAKRIEKGLKVTVNSDIKADIRILRSINRVKETE